MIANTINHMLIKHMKKGKSEKESPKKIKCLYYIYVQNQQAQITI